MTVDKESRLLATYHDLYSHKIDLCHRLAQCETSYKYWIGIQHKANAHASDLAAQMEELAAELASLDAHIAMVERGLPDYASHFRYALERSTQRHHE